MDQPLVLIVHSDAAVRALLDRMLPSFGYATRAVTSGEEAIDEVARGDVTVALLDLDLPGMSGADTLRAIRAMSPAPEVVVTSGRGTVTAAAEAARARGLRLRPTALRLQGPQSRPAHGPRTGRPAAADARTWKRRSRPTTPSRRSSGGAPGSSTCSPWSTRPPGPSRRSSSKGESGTGKELVARALHANSPRAATPLTIVDCGALQDTLLESELFGHERGAFTGAHGLKHGLLETANQGTLFLDEIGEMSPATQVKVLRALQSGEFRRIGSNRHIKADIRVIAATNKDLREEVQRARFREDLYYRIAVIEIHMPPLRERTEDIPFLVEHFLRVNAYGGRERLQVTPEAMSLPDEVRLARQHPGAAERHRAALGARRQPGARRSTPCPRRSRSRRRSRPRPTAPVRPAGDATGRRAAPTSRSTRWSATTSCGRWSGTAGTRSASRASSASTRRRSTTSSDATAFRSACGARAMRPPPPPRLERAEANMSHDAASPAQTAAAAERERILVCDDDPRMRDTIVEALAAEGFDVDTADRAVDAIQRIMRTSYRALILDLKLPGLGGLDAIAVVKRFDESLPIIVMTGHASYEVEQAARAAGNLLLPGQAVQSRRAGRRPSAPPSGSATAAVGGPEAGPAWPLASASRSARGPRRDLGAPRPPPGAPAPHPSDGPAARGRPARRCRGSRARATFRAVGGPVLPDVGLVLRLHDADHVGPLDVPPGDRRGHPGPGSTPAERASCSPRPPTLQAEDLEDLLSHPAPADVAATDEQNAHGVRRSAARARGGRPARRPRLARRSRRNRKNSTPSRSRRRMTAGSRSIPPTIATIFRGRK